MVWGLSADMNTYLLYCPRYLPQVPTYLTTSRQKGTFSACASGCTYSSHYNGDGVLNLTKV